MAFRTFIFHFGLMGTSLLFCACSNIEKGEKQAQVEEAIEKKIEEANRYLHEGNVTEAFNMLDELQEVYPKHMGVLESLVFAYMEVEDYGLAAFYSEQVTNIEETMPQHFIFAAQSYSKVGEWEKAAQNFKKYLDLYPNDTATWKNLAKLYEVSEQREEAFEAHIKLYQLSHEMLDAEAIEVMSSIYAETGDFSKTEWQYEETLSQGEAKSFAGENVEHFAAIEKLWESISGQPAVKQTPYKHWDQAFLKNLSSIQSRGKTTREEEVNESTSEEKTLTQSEPELGVSMARKVPAYEKAVAFRESGDYQQALKAYWQALAKQPEDVALWHELCAVYYQIEDYYHAEMVILEAMRRVPRHLGIRMNYLKIVQHRYSSEELMAELRKAKAEFPRNADITLALAQGYASTGDRRAEILYRQFLQEASIDHPKHVQVRALLESL